MDGFLVCYQTLHLSEQKCNKLGRVQQFLISDDTVEVEAFTLGFYSDTDQRTSQRGSGTSCRHVQ